MQRAIDMFRGFMFPLVRLLVGVAVLGGVGAARALEAPLALQQVRPALAASHGNMSGSHDDTSI